MIHGEPILYAAEVLSEEYFSSATDHRHFSIPLEFAWVRWQHRRSFGARFLVARELRILQDFRWNRFKNLEAREMYTVISEHVFPWQGCIFVPLCSHPPIPNALASVARDSPEGVRFSCLSKQRLNKRPYR
jgi:hypothetical protein